MYEPSVRVPAIVWSPGRVQGGKIIDDLVSLFDFGPTILELTGLTAPKWMEARSLKPYLSGDQISPREFVFSEHAGDRILSGTEFMTMIRDWQYKLIHFVENDEGQLFDLIADPKEVNDLWDDVEHQNIKRHLINEILKWRIRSDLKTQGWTEAIVHEGAGRTPAGTVHNAG